MRKIAILVILLTGGVLLLSYHAPTRGADGRFVYQDSLAAERDKIIRTIIDSLKDKSGMAADSVFDNLQLFGSLHRLKVKDLLGVMNYWGESLGVSCNYCHSVGKWASDDSENKKDCQGYV